MTGHRTPTGIVHDTSHQHTHTSDAAIMVNGVSEPSACAMPIAMAVCQNPATDHNVQVSPLSYYAADSGTTPHST